MTENDLQRALAAAGRYLVEPKFVIDDTVRDCVVERMVAVHLVSRELAEQWVAKMDDEEIVRRIAMYARIEDERAGKELSAVGAKNRVDLISTRFLDPRQRRHASRHSTPFPSSRRSNEAGKSLPELEAKNRVRVRIAR